MRHRTYTDTAIEFNGEFYCEDCLDEHMVICDCCNARVLREDAQIDSNYTLCSDCYYEHYSYCEECGAIIANEDCYYIDECDEYPYCYNCFQRNQKDKGIHDYSYKPKPIFHSNGSRYFGVELEVDYGGHSDDNAREVLDIANDEHESKLTIELKKLTYPDFVKFGQIRKGDKTGKGIKGVKLLDLC